MLHVHWELKGNLKGYKNINDKISRMIKSGELIPIKRGLYEDDPTTPPQILAGVIYGPSYLSFEWALSYWGLIPEYVVTLTSATVNKRRHKSYKTPFGRFSYQDVPAKAFPYGQIYRECSYAGFMIATPQKAILDMLYIKPKLETIQDMEDWLFEDMRFDEEIFFNLDFSQDGHMQMLYRRRNIYLFFQYLDSELYQNRRKEWLEP